ncbi:MAG TPA: acyltransferase family protein [Anaerolineales bacterium]|nr:acyltransferase family protein [Anaerolineales bacterium]
MSDQTARQETIPWIDLIRVVAIFLVVVIHVSGQLTNLWGKVSDEQWIIADIYGGIARIAVPLFFMISGYLLLPRSESLSVFYTKRMLKILIPFLVWSLIYLGWYCGNHPNTCTPSLAWDLLLVQGTYYHLWFLYSLISIYLILPILRLMIKPDTDNRILWYLIVLWLIFQPALTSAHKFWNFSIKLNAPLATGFVCYFVLGYLLAEITLSRTRIILSTAIWVIGTLITIFGTYLFTRNSGQFEGFFYDFVSINVILISSAAFLLLRWVSERKPFTSPNAQAMLRTIATRTFGIYLIHILIIEVLSSWIPFLHLNSLMGNAIWSVPLVSTVVFTLSFLIVRILQKIPILKYIVP